MKKKILFIILLAFCFSLTGCSRSITYKTFEKNIKNGDSMIVEIIQDGCSHCEAFEPVFSKFMKENDLEYVKLNLANVTDEDYEVLSTQYGVTGTPTVLLIKDGKVLSDYTIAGEATRAELEKVFKQAGYIK